LTVTDIAELHARQRRIEIVTAQSAFIDGYRARGIPLGIFQSVLAERDLTETGNYNGNVRMIWAKRLLADGRIVVLVVGRGVGGDRAAFAENQPGAQNETRPKNRSQFSVQFL
jgi:hypothetical protein